MHIHQPSAEDKTALADLDVHCLTVDDGRLRCLRLDRLTSLQGGDRDHSTQRALDTLPASEAVKAFSSPNPDEARLLRLAAVV